MVTELNPLSSGRVRLVLEPNQSLSWTGNLYVSLSLLIISLIISVVFALFGAWVVLPFALLEVILLVSIFYYINQHLRCQEVVSIDDQHVLIEKGSQRPEQIWDFCRGKVSVVVQQQNEPVDHDMVIISGDQGIVTVGEFLNNQDAKQLIKSLKRSGLRTTVQGPVVSRSF